MDGGGGDREALLGTTTWPCVSRLQHGGARWILQAEPVPGERTHLFAVREDGAVRVRLTSDPYMQYQNIYDWAPDEDATDATIGVVARRWTGAPLGGSVVASSCGIYTARLLFDAGGAVVGLDAEPTMALFVGATGPAGNESADVSSFAWSPDMTRIVWETGGDHSFEYPHQLRVADLAQATFTNLGPGGFPAWSPDGTEIACSRDIAGSTNTTVIERLRPDGSGRATVVSHKLRLGASKSQHVSGPRWSPDGAYLAYRHRLQDGSRTQTSYVHRVSAAGGGITNLTPEVAPIADQVSGAFLVDWR
jgi:dipeptidyl aminopeptidase/acylaminoacyl peptidase